MKFLEKKPELKSTDVEFKISIFEFGDKDSKVCGNDSENISYLEEKYLVCTRHESNKKIKQALKDDFKKLALFVCAHEYKNSYYVDQKHIIMIHNYDCEEISFKRIEIKGITDEEREIFVEEETELFFEGQPKRQIEETLKTISKDIKKTNFIKIILMILIIILLGYYFLEPLYRDPPEILRKTPPKPVVNALTELEKRNIKRAVSIRTIKYLKREINTYIEEENLSKIRRNINFSLVEGREIPPVEPELVENKRWEYPAGPRRGAIAYNINKIDQQIFPGVGYEKQSEGIYSKSIDSEIILDEKYLDNQEEYADLKLSSYCLKGVLSLDESIDPIRRSEDEIVISATKVLPSKIKDDFYNIILKCPIIISEISQEEEYFNISLILYKTRVQKAKSGEL